MQKFISGGENGAVIRFPALTEAQDAIRDISAELREVERRLVRLCATLPEPRGEFEPLSELRGVLECVSNDLLGDAIATLEASAGRDVLGLHAEYLERQRMGVC